MNFFIIIRSALKTTRLFSTHSALYVPSPEEAMRLANKGQTMEEYVKVTDDHIKELNSLTKEEAIGYCKDEESKLKGDYKRAIEGHDYVDMDKDHELRLVDDFKIQSELQALQAAQRESKHKLSDKDLEENDTHAKKTSESDYNSSSSKHKTPADNKERDEFLANQQQSEPLDFSDPDG